MKPTKKAPAKKTPAKKPTGKTAQKVVNTTRTPDGGQQYMRDTKKPFSVSDRYSESAMGTRGATLSPKAAEMMGRSAGYAINPRKGIPGLAKIGREGAEGMNQIARDYGDKKGRR